MPTQADLDSLARHLAPAADTLADVTERAALPVRDPFAPAPVEAPVPTVVVRRPPPRPAASPGPSWTVSAILITDGRRVAVIDEALVSPGDRLPGGARVAEIERDHVTLIEPGGTRRVLRIRDRGTP